MATPHGASGEDQPITSEGARALWFRVADLLADISARLEISGEVLLGLPIEDDWSFVVKTHALIETALAHLLTETLGRSELAKFFGRLPLQGRTSKLEVAESLDLLTNGQRDLAVFIATTRNRLVHSARNWSFSFEHLFEEDPSSLKKVVAIIWNRDVSEASKLEEFARDNTKFVLFLRLIELLAHVYTSSRRAEYERRLQELNTQFAESVHSSDE